MAFSAVFGGFGFTDVVLMNQLIPLFHSVERIRILGYWIATQPNRRISRSFESAGWNPRSLRRPLCSTDFFATLTRHDIDDLRCVIKRSVGDSH